MKPHPGSAIVKAFFAFASNQLPENSRIASYFRAQPDLLEAEVAYYSQASFAATNLQATHHYASYHHPTKHHTTDHHSKCGLGCPNCDLSIHVVPGVRAAGPPPMLPLLPSGQGLDFLFPFH